MAQIDRLTDEQAAELARIEGIALRLVKTMAAIIIEGQVADAASAERFRLICNKVFDLHNTLMDEIFDEEEEWEEW